MNKPSLSALLGTLMLSPLLLLLGAGCATAPRTFVVVSPSYDQDHIRRVALIGFSDSPGMAGSGEAAASIFEKYLLLGGYSLVERRQVAEVLKEQALRSNGSFDQSTLQKLGSLLGVRALAFGSINDLVSPRQETVMVNMPQEQSSPIYGQVETIHKDGDNVSKVTQNYVADYNVTWTDQVVPQTSHVPAHAGISVRLVSVENGEVLWSASASSEGDYVNEALERASSDLMQAVGKRVNEPPEK